MISSAADRAIEKLDLGIVPGTKVLLRSYDLEAYDKGYVVGALRDRLLRDGADLVDDQSRAEVILEVRAGALSIDKRSDLLGIPSFTLPIPLAGPFQTPELALFKRERQEGIAKLAVTSYDRESGALHSSSGPSYGSATRDRWVVLVFSWTDEDIGRQGGDAGAQERKPPGDGR